MRATISLLPGIVISILALGAVSFAQVKVAPRSRQQNETKRPADQVGEVGKFSGPGSCAASNCHGGIQPKTLLRISQNEYSIWAGQDKHSRAYGVLSNATSLRMGKILGLEQAPNQSAKCLACHALHVKPELRAQTFQTLEDGVSCESCHGPAVGWLGPHTLKNWTHEQSLKLGMNDTRDLARRTQRCLTCHLGTAEKEVDHTMIAAGHPDLTFQLEAFSSSMPRHWKAAPNSSPWLNVQELATGQAVQLREALHRLSRHASGGNWPEYAEYECFACHHSLTKSETSWRQAGGYGGRQPGAPVWNPASFVVFRHIGIVVDASATDELVSQLRQIEQLSGRLANKDQVASLAEKAAESADRLSQRVQAQPYDRVVTVRLLQEISNDSDAISLAGERSAEQATMALDSLSLAYVKNEQVANQAELRAAINELLQQVDNPSGYNAPRFAAKLQKVATLVPRSQARSGASRTKKRPSSGSDR